MITQLGLGSKKANMNFFKDCSYVMQFDRRSYTTDLIDRTNGIQVLSDEFKNIVTPLMEEYSYRFNTGTFTDVGCLSNAGIGICTMNISNGSFDEHGDNEKCGINHLLNALNFGIEIITKVPNKRYIFIQPVKKPYVWDGKSKTNVIKPSSSALNNAWNEDIDYENWEYNKETNTWAPPKNKPFFHWDRESKQWVEKKEISDYSDYNVLGENEGSWIEANDIDIQNFEDGGCGECGMFDVINDVSESEKYCNHCGMTYYIPEHLRKKKRSGIANERIFN